MRSDDEKLGGISEVGGGSVEKTGVDSEMNLGTCGINSKVATGVVVVGPNENRLFHLTLFFWATVEWQTVGIADSGQD